jgi:glycosyltransferase involved in cell wall biosynthesis
MKRKPSILYVITSFDHGGAQKNMLELARRAKESGRYDVFAAALKDGGIYERRFREAGIETATLGMEENGIAALVSLPAAFARLVALAEKTSADIIHSFLFRANFLSRFAALLAGSSNISSVRVMEKEKKFALLCSRLTGFTVDALTVNSRDLFAFASATEGMPPSKIKLINNYISTREVDEKARGAVPEYGSKDGSFVVAAVGRLSRQKGFEYLIEAVNLIKDDMPELSVVIAGDGQLRGALAAKIKAFGLDGRIKLAGALSDTSSLMSSADLLAIPSLWEGFPNVALEAAAAKTPVIASDSSCLSGFVEPEYVFAAADAVDLAHKILEVGRNRPKASEYALRLYARLDGYTGAKAFEQYFALYDEVFAKR